MIERWEKVFKALGQETRLKLFLALAHDSLCVCQLENAFSSSQSAISQHLRVLREAGLVEAERQSLWTFYRADVDALDTLLQAFKRALDDEIPAEIEDIRRTAGQVKVEVCSTDSLLER